MDEEEEMPGEASAGDIAAQPKASDGYLFYGVASWGGFVACKVGILPDSLNAIVFLLSMLFGAYVLKSAPIRSPARIHAAIGMSLWLVTFLILHLLWIGR